jgi:hypothetical protein
MGIWAPLGSVAMAAVSTACCWLPLVTVALGLGAGGAAAIFDPYRWVFLGLASVLLALGFYFNYRRDAHCDPDGSCPPERRRLRAVNRVVLWSSSVLVVTFGLFPELTAIISERTPPRDSTTSWPWPIRLSDDAHELRDAFNHDVGSVRLVTLLSPT